ncbi:kinase-like domain-containing protein [Mucor mucedo]|uniref:kinase-like domain-containing protein n=1 Tax=Mucor mucedo TaxID=29922 RepID=UPI00221E85F1|nr:kinase-like domain-containing protein [Mucor mucedo]KAI7876641.1 kinase-like domain-containing protein [Mucor mucedo]
MTIMPGTLEGQKHISVFETTLSIQQNTLSVFNIIIQSSQSTVSLIRYPFDLIEFHQKIRFHYPKCKVSFPTLSNPSKKKSQEQQRNLRYLKRRSFRDLLPFPRKKSNADKIERYLERCFGHPIISISSILRDFTSVQRDEDALLTSQHTSTTLISTIHKLTTEFKQQKKVVSPLPVSMKDFKLLQVLGKGCMGKVVLLVRSKRDGQLYALKSIKKNWVIQQKEIVHTRAERDILVLLRDQPFLVNLHHVFQDPSQLFLVLDYYAGGDIATQLSIMSSFGEDRTRFYAAEIIHGLGILHQYGIVYRDLKPENVLIGRDGHIVLTDFGLSKIFSVDDVDEENVPTTQTFCGTAEYLAPEILLGERYTFVVDFWSLGTLLFEMLAGTTPFWADTHMEMYKRVLEDNLEFPSRFDPITCNFLTGLLEKEACERLGWGEDGIEDIKSHPYFESIDWNIVAQRKMIPPYIPSIKNETDLSNFDEMFTNMPPRISQSSYTGSNLEGDPFEDFSYDPIIFSSTGHNDTVVPEPVNQGRMRKRHSAALSFNATGEPSSSGSNQLFEDNRAIKKRQTTSQHKMSHSSLADLVTSPSISSLGDIIHREEDEEEASSIYSRSSLTFSFGAQVTTATRAGSELSLDEEISNTTMHHFFNNGHQPEQCISQQSSPYERPNCPIPGQSRINNTPHSNTSTLANSMCSYLTVDNNEELTNVVQPNYFSYQQQASSSSA